MSKCKSLFIAVCMAISCICQAQSTNEYFSPLSAGFYAQKITLLKARKVPVEYTDKKEQKTYADIIADRNKSILEDFENNRVVADTLLLNKSNAIVQRIKAANTNFNFDDISVYINRSCVANASCYGEGTLFINLGLFLWVDNDDELAMVIAHELSHQFLNHSESKIKKNIALISSDEFKDEMKAIKKSSDGRYTRYKKLMTDLVTQNGTHSRYKESEADSLAASLIKKAGYNIDVAAKILLKLDHVDDLFIGKDLYNVKAAFAQSAGDTIAAKPKKYNGLSMVNVTMNADKELDSVKTHPDCIERYKKVLAINAVNAQPTCCLALSGRQDYKERAMIEIIRYEYEIENYTLCTHLCLFALKNGYKGSFYSSMLSSCFSAVYDADKHLRKFSVTNANASPGSTLKELQDFIFDSNSGNIENISEKFLKATTQNTDDASFAQLRFNEQVKGMESQSQEKSFITSFPTSKYNYFFNPKTK